MTGENKNVFTILSQYTKDLSFENPACSRPPSGLEKKQPEIKLELKVVPTLIKQDDSNETEHEVCLTLKAQAFIGEKNLFLLEFQYAGHVKLGGMSSENKNDALYVHVPTMLYPYLSRIVSDITRDAGYAPLTLRMVNFRDIRRMEVEKAKEKAAPSNSNTKDNS